MVDSGSRREGGGRADAGLRRGLFDGIPAVARDEMSTSLVISSFFTPMAGELCTHLSESFAALACVFFLLGCGILQSIEKATQFVHGTPRLAASHRTCEFVNIVSSYEDVLDSCSCAIVFASGWRYKEKVSIRTFRAWHVCWKASGQWMMHGVKYGSHFSRCLGTIRIIPPRAPD